MTRGEAAEASLHGSRGRPVEARRKEWYDKCALLLITWEGCGRYLGIVKLDHERTAAAGCWLALLKLLELPELPKVPKLAKLPDFPRQWTGV